MHEYIEFQRAEKLRQLISAFQGKGIRIIDGEVYDFTKAQSNIALYLAGHSHEDMQNYVDGTLYVSVPSDSWNSSQGAMHTFHPYPKRKHGSVSEQCFDVCVLDRNSGFAQFVRIGYGFNRRFNLLPIDMRVGDMANLTSVFGNVSHWLIHDSKGAAYDSSISAEAERWSFTNNVATISDGIVTAKSSGECYAIAIADNGDKEFFYIDVK